MLRALATSSSKGARYALAIVAVVLCFLLRFVLDPWLGERAPFLIDTLVLLACALYLGWGPAAVAALIAAALGAIKFARGGYSIADLMNIALFAAVCFGIIVLADRVRRANFRASQDQSRAESNRSRADAYAEELNLLIDGASDYAIFMTDPEGRVTIWNRGAERVLGWSEEEIVGRRSAAFYPPDEAGAGRAEQDLQSALAEGRFSEETWQLRKDGSEFLADATITPLFDDVGALRGFAKVLRDVTDRHASERAVERRERLLRSILETVPDAMIVIDEQGLIVSFSAAAQATFGYTAEEVVGTNVSRLMPSPDRDRHDGYLERYLQTGERRIIGIGRIVTGLRKDGRAFPMELSVGEAMTDGQRLFTGFVRDLTDKQRTEARLQELQSELIHVSRLTAMGTMAATLAHELNQPLTAIANYAEAMSGVIDATGEEEKELVREILQDMTAQAMRAGAIVRRLREFIARGDVDKRLEDLPALIREAAALALVGAHERGVTAQLQLDPDATPVLVDRVQIQQVLINLIRNAVEAMDGSELREIVISSSLQDAETARVSVRDTGPGIAPEIADQLFQAFVSTKGSGMGLGLSICQTIIEAHGGRIKAQPAEGGGTEFQFTLPRAHPED